MQPGHRQRTAPGPGQGPCASLVFLCFVFVFVWLSSEFIVFAIEKKCFELVAFRLGEVSSSKWNQGAVKTGSGGLQESFAHDFVSNGPQEIQKKRVQKASNKNRPPYLCFSFSPRASWTQIRPGNWRRAARIARIWGQSCPEDCSNGLRGNRKLQINMPEIKQMIKTKPSKEKQWKAINNKEQKTNESQYVLVCLRLRLCPCLSVCLSVCCLSS